jgi:hypothetical protein
MERQVVNSAIIMSLYFNTATTRDTLEQIDVARSLIDKYPDVSQR